jgi:hypothetical protein
MVASSISKVKVVTTTFNKMDKSIATSEYAIQKIQSEIENIKQEAKVMSIYHLRL